VGSKVVNGIFISHFLHSLHDVTPECFRRALVRSARENLPSARRPKSELAVVLARPHRFVEVRVLAKAFQGAELTLNKGYEEVAPLVSWWRVVV
jgi:hypothetical protein